ncbi:MAG TPA: ABC-type transport auxiliary lipoprotein family protein [Halomonas sp.]|nr:ABC-type transport auxiliary lipoprotein family protein [Halomonas sp.]
MRTLLRAIPVQSTSLVAALLLSACSVLPTPTPLRTFTLPEAPLEKLPQERRIADAAPTLDLTLRVETPRANAPLDGVRILVQPSARELKIYAGSRWRDRAPVLLQERLIHALRRGGRLGAIVDDSSRARDDVLLSSRLAGFHSRYRQDAPEVVIELDAQLIDARQGRVLASRRFSSVQPADGENIEAIVAAFGRAADRLDRQIVDWTAARLGEAAKRRATARFPDR